MTAETIHTCSYACDRPACIRAQRDELAARAEAQEGAGYSIDADPAGIRARVADAITGALAFGAQGNHKPPAGHWLEPFWNMARAEAQAQGGGEVEGG